MYVSTYEGKIHAVQLMIRVRGGGVDGNQESKDFRTQYNFDCNNSLEWLKDALKKMSFNFLTAVTPQPQTPKSQVGLQWSENALKKLRFKFLTKVWLQRRAVVGGPGSQPPSPLSDQMVQQNEKFYTPNLKDIFI